jgi:uncharacterized protein
MTAQADLHVIHKKGRYVVFHPDSFSLFCVEENIGRILEFYETLSKDISLIAKVFDTSEYYIENLLKYFSDNAVYNTTMDLEWTNGEPRALNLLISQDCNLKCGYCYANHGTYGREKKLMDFDTARKSIDKLLSNEYQNFIVFFGGEPLLNFPLIVEIDSYLTEKGLRAKYTAITNGTIINDEIKKFIEEKFFALGISLDGAKELNDLQRYGSVESVHDSVLETINKLKYRHYTLSIKSIVTKKNANRITDIVTYISSLDVDSMAVESVNDIPPESEFYLSDEDYAAYIYKLASIITNIIREVANGNRVVFGSYIFDILRQIVTKTRKINMCSGGREFITITADGDVYPCHMYIGIDEFKMGNVHDDDFPGRKFAEIREIFYNANVYTSTNCKNCWARFLCGGECHYFSYISNNDLSTPREQRCMEMKAVIEALLPEIADIFLDEIKTKNLLNSIKSRAKNLPTDIC